MTKVLIISDSHGLTNQIDEIVERHKVDVMFHCGDSELAHDSPHLEGFHIVRGNCDWDHTFEEEIVMNVNGLRIFVTHGHLFGIKSSLLQLQYRAQEVEANIVLYGHSHVAYCEKHEDQLFINPGSIRSPRRWSIPSYCIISWENRDEINVTYYDVDGNIADEFPFRTTFHL